MTSLDPGTVRIRTLAVRGDAVLTDALHHAVLRDLDRLSRVLRDPVTAVRRGALIEHTRFILDRLQEHHRVLDQISWPGVMATRPDLADVAGGVAQAHHELTEQLHSVRNCSLEWRGNPVRRLDVLAAVRELWAVLSPVLDHDSELAPLIDEVLAGQPAAYPPGRRTWVGAPTRLARRTFWLLDDLDSRQADLLTQRTPRAATWVLRNGFSGAYNRSAYLMWMGGGNGPAV